MELTGAAEAAQKVRDEKSERLWRKVTRRGSVGVERWVRPDHITNFLESEVLAALVGLVFKKIS